MKYKKKNEGIKEERMSDKENKKLRVKKKT